MANKRFIVRHGLDNSGDNSVVNTITNVAEPVNNSDAATKYYVDTHTTGGTVTSVTATSPVESTGGTAPVISLGTGANGQLVIGTGTGFTKSTLTAGTGVSIANASGSITISATGSGGDVVGPASSTDNAVVRFDGTTGKLIQNSTATLSDAGLLTVSELSTTSITSTGNNPIVIAPDGTGDVHLNADSVRIGDNNTDATLVTRGTGDLLLTTNEGSAVEGVIRIYDGANGNITLTPNGTGQVQVGSDQVVTLAASQTLTNKTLSSNSVWNGNVIGSAYGGAGTVNGILKANGSGTVSAASAGTDYVTSVSVTSPVSNTGTSANPTIALASGYGDTQNPYGSKTANYFLASPNGSAGVPTWRSIVAADIPTLNQNTTGNAATASALQTARNINGVSFNGTADITVTAAASTLTGTTLASGVTASSLTSVGTITTGTWNASAIGVAYGGTGLTTLTAGYIPYGNGTSAFGSSANLFWDSANSRLGIGTSSPRAKLETSGSIFATSRSIPTGGAGPEIWWSGTVSGISSYDRTNSAYKPLLLEAEYSYFTTANGSEQMRINNTGVGIGTASPYNKLEIEGASARLGLNNGGGASRKALLIEPLGYGGNAYARLESYDYGTSTGGVLALNVTGGNVGIGTSSPQAKLNTSESSNSTVWSAIFQNSSNAASGNAVGIKFKISDFSTTAESTKWVGISSVGIGANYNDYMGLAFYTKNGASVTPAETMRLDNVGNLGIGTSSPAFKLHTYIASGTSMFKFESGANAGIYGYWTRPNQSYIQALNLDNNGDKDFSLYDATNGQVADRYYPSSTGYRAFFTNGSERMRIDSSGNVGIGGTASSGTRLYVVGSNTTSNTSIPIYANQVYGNTGVSSAALRLNLNDGAGGCYLYGYSGGAGFMHNAEYLAGTGWTARSTFASIMETTSSGFSFYLNSSLTAGNTFTPSEQMRLTSTGLGIGTSSPTVGLHVVKDQGSGYIAAFRANTSSPYITLQTTSGITQIQGINSAFTDVNNIAMQLSGGNVGIGTSSPASKLNVSGGNVTVSAGYGIAWSGDQNRIMTPEDNVSGALIRYGSGGICRFLNGSTEHFRVDSSGNVKALGVLLGNNGTKGYGAITTTTSTSTPTGGSSGDHYYIY